MPLYQFIELVYGLGNLTIDLKIENMRRLHPMVVLTRPIVIAYFLGSLTG